jgi:DUF2911 family protein
LNANGQRGSAKERREESAQLQSPTQAKKRLERATSLENGKASEMKRILLSALLLSGMMLAVAHVKKEELVTKNTKSPGAETSLIINGKNIWIYYHAPSVRGRHIFGGAGALQPDGSVWRLGANYATVLHTDADLDLSGLAIPKGDYALYADLDNGQWKLIVNKTLMAGGRHIWGVGVSPDGIREGATTDDPATELGRASVTMGKPSSLVETLKITLSGAGARGKLLIEWENVTASAPFTVR